MKLHKFSWLKPTLLFSLAGVFLFAATVQDAHYLFVTHDFVSAGHSGSPVYSTEHSNCNLCKIDLGYFVQTFSQFELPCQVFAADRTIYNLSDIIISNQFAAISLRGPPARA